jgi:hypothetical protein
VKSLLKQTAAPIPNFTVDAQGAGRIRAYHALLGQPSSETQLLTATGTGTLEGSRGSSGRVKVMCDGVEKVVSDETSSWCEAWNGASWRTSTWSGASWRSDGWDGASWRTDAWSGASWRNASWTGASWRTDTWSGASWRVAGWSDSTWKDGTWTTAEYEEEEVFLTGFWGSGTQPGRPLPGELSEDEAERALAHAASQAAPSAVVGELPQPPVVPQPEVPPVTAPPVTAPPVTAPQPVAGLHCGPRARPCP